MSLLTSSSEHLQMVTECKLELLGTCVLALEMFVSPNPCFSPALGVQG